MSRLLAMVSAVLMAMAAGGCASDMKDDEMKDEETTKKEELNSRGM